MTTNSGTPVPMCYLRVLNGKPDWSEDCVGEDAQLLLDDYPADEGYRAIPVYDWPDMVTLNSQLAAVTAERDQKRKENDALRALQVGIKCAYGQRMDNGACSLGYPGCACMDDLCATLEWGPDDIQAQTNKRLLERAERAEAALADAERRGMEMAAEVVPSNWCDPALTGKSGLGPPPYDCRHIEQLLRSVKATILAAAEQVKR